MLCYARLCYAMLCYTILCYATIISHHLASLISVHTSQDQYQDQILNTSIIYQSEPKAPRVVPILVLVIDNSYRRMFHTNLPWKIMLYRIMIYVHVYVHVYVCIASQSVSGVLDLGRSHSFQPPTNQT
ncbi:hypothetical protein F5890DRAFT_1537002 [Lentinula detonsa]|uniref:Uncharacterized protein n=1 Tax=Lentinula detonsa TaxID=2804962 RepID=A0AA38URB3_9AGAR|nr:hypothetical protein F5890DRAFT_1537002 [Lentinula detonsa]